MRRPEGLPEAFNIKVDQWMHIQQLDYEKIPFKCKVFHEYGHFYNRCSKKHDSEDLGSPQAKWEQVKKK